MPAASFSGHIIDKHKLVIICISIGIMRKHVNDSLYLRQIGISPATSVYQLIALSIRNRNLTLNFLDSFSNCNAF